MSRKRSHRKAFTMTESLENDIYLLPGCYYSPQLECTICEECCSDSQPFVMEEHPHLNAFTGVGLYIADACGNIFYNSDIGYICEEIVCCSEARMESDELSDPGSECDNKRTRSNPSSDEEEANNDDKKEFPGYIVEEPPDDEDMKPPNDRNMKTSSK